MSSTPLIVASPLPRTPTIERTINQIKTFIRPQDHGPRGRARVGLFLALAILFVLTTTFNLVFVYSRWGWAWGRYGYYHHNNAGFITSMVIQCLCSVAMLVLSTTIVKEFITSFIVAILGMCIYIFIEFMVGYGWVNETKVATWSVLTFWIVFVADAVTNFGFHLTTWLAKKIVEQDTGRIRLADDVLPHGGQLQQQQGQYRDSSPSPRPSSRQESGVMNIETSQPRDNANVDLESGKQEGQIYA